MELAAYRALRRQYVPAEALQMTFFVGSRGVHRVNRWEIGGCTDFHQLREQLGWIDRGGHGRPRVHDRFRRQIAVRRMILWHQRGEPTNLMLALSTYMGHINISSARTGT